MDKTTMIRTINNILAIMGEDNLEIKDLNYKESLEEFESVISDFNEYVENHGVSEEDIMDHLEEFTDDEVTEELPKPEVKQKPEPRGYTVVTAEEFFRNIGFAKAVSSATLDNLEIREYISEGKLCHNFWILPKYYLQNQKRMYRFVQDIQKSCKARGAKCKMVRNPGGASFCKVTWPN